MSPHTKLALLATILALAVAPAAALAGDTPTHPGPPTNKGAGSASAHRSGKSHQPGPRASLPEKAKAYGYYCRDQSKTHVAGQRGTPFSQCVTAMAKLAKGTTPSPRAACASLSHRHVKGERGTPFSRCVKAGARLLRDQRKR
jgi:hypothetical protein